jgi:hypothetical protein
MISDKKYSLVIYIVTIFFYLSIVADDHFWHFAHDLTRGFEDF